MLTLEENTALLYPKILTAFERGDRYKFVQNPDTQIMGGYQWCKPEFDEIKTFEVTQKIDGTNTRVVYKNGKVYFLGKTEESTFLHEHILKLESIFPVEKLKFVFGDKDVTLYGEFFGGKIQAGSTVNQEEDFILFDVKIGDLWLLFKDIKDIAEKLNINVVPFIGLLNIDEIIEIAKNGYPSLIPTIPTPEGIIAKSASGLRFTDGERVMFKLKSKDFKQGGSAKTDLFDGGRHPLLQLMFPEEKS
jgi:hypothetical protein